jgi:excisionase family DNA binding protein
MNSTKVIGRRQNSTAVGCDVGGSELDAAVGDRVIAAMRTARTETTLSIQQAALCLGISASTAYRLAEKGRFPVAILRIGGQYKVPSRPLLQALGHGLDDKEAQR